MKPLLFVCPKCGQLFSYENWFVWVLHTPFHCFGERLTKCPVCGEKSLMRGKTTLYEEDLKDLNTESYDDTFVKEVKKHNMTEPLEILNWYRNLYHCEDNNTEQGIMAHAINDLFVKYKKELNL